MSTPVHLFISELSTARAADKSPNFTKLQAITDKHNGRMKLCVTDDILQCKSRRSLEEEEVNSNGHIGDTLDGVLKSFTKN